MPRKKTHKEFIEEQKIKNPNLIFFGKYDGNKTPIKAKCTICNYSWEPYPCHLSKTKHSGCPRCAGRAPYTAKEYKERLKKDNPTIINTEDYVDTSTSIWFKCLICDHTWKSTPGHLVGNNPHGCRKCKNKIAGEKKRKSYKEFAALLQKNNPSVRVIGKYISMTENIKVECKKCKHKWEPKAGDVARGTSRCKDCGNKSSSIKRTKDPAIFAKELKKVHPDYKIIKGYTQNKEKVILKCSHQHTFPANPYEVLNGHGCPLCAHNGTSFAEKFIVHSLKQTLGNENVIERDRKLIGKEIDILIPEYKIAIEYGSWYWHKNKLNNDFDKQKLCIQKDFKPIVIYDSVTEAQSINSVGFKNLYLYENDLGSQNNLSNLQQLVNDLLKTYFNKSPIKNFNNIKKLASNDSLPISTKDFQKKLTLKHPGYIVKGEYLGSKIHTEIICPKGHTITPTPNQILHKNYNCPECSKNKPNPKKMSKEDFNSKLKKKHPHITLIGEYKGLDEKAEFICNICKTSRITKASRVLYSKYGCNICSRKNAGLNQRKTHDEFVMQLKKIKPTIEVIGKYELSSKNILVRCKTCQHEWDAEPGHLLTKEKRGCPKCAKKKVIAASQKKLKCIETNKVFPSAKQADIHYGFAKGTVSRSCRTGNPAKNNLHFHYI